jgi:methionine aminopeptidase
LQTSDEVAALDFDLACTVELAEYDKEKHQQLIEALTAGALMNSISKVIPHK